LQLLNKSESDESPWQSLWKSLMQQFNAIAVNCLANWSLCVLLTLTQIASTAEAALFIGTVALMHSPQISSDPPHASITICVMFWLVFFSVPAWVPQKPGVRQMASWQGGVEQVAESESVAVWPEIAPVPEHVTVSVVDSPGVPS
jgi:hypothetical protein